MSSRLALAFSGLLALVLLTSCTYGHKQFQKAEGPLNGPDDFVIQVDDFGQFWDKSEPEGALKHIRKLSEESNVIVVLFVHGWNHDAAPCDENLCDFAKSMSHNRNELNSPLFKAARMQLSNSESISVVSIYVSWRGRSLPGRLNYATFRGRKAAAERVGGGDLREFLVRLNALYLERREPPDKGDAKYFMGMTTIGHSFGAQVLFRAVASEIENQLIAKNPEADSSAVHSGPVSDLIGFGDLVLLINPALEAMQFERIWRLSNNLAFGQRQNPVMLIISSGGDFPRQVFFPMGRHLDALLLRPSFREEQRAMWTQALGEYEPFRTHKIDTIDESCTPTSEFDPNTSDEDPFTIINQYIANNSPGKCLKPKPKPKPKSDTDTSKKCECDIADMNPTNSKPAESFPQKPEIDLCKLNKLQAAVADVDLTNNIPAIAGLRLSKIKYRKDNNPFLVVYASTKVVKNHSKIFERSLRDFANLYIGLAQAKRMINSQKDACSKQ